MIAVSLRVMTIVARFVEFAVERDLPVLVETLNSERIEGESTTSLFSGLEKIENFLSELKFPVSSEFKTLISRIPFFRTFVYCQSFDYDVNKKKKRKKQNKSNLIGQRKCFLVYDL